MDAEVTLKAINALSAQPVRVVLFGPDPHPRGGLCVRFPEGELAIPLEDAEGEWLVGDAALLVTAGQDRTLIFRVGSKPARCAVAELLHREMGADRADALLRRVERKSKRSRPRKRGRT